GSTVCPIQAKSGLNLKLWRYTNCHLWICYGRLSRFTELITTPMKYSALACYRLKRGGALKTVATARNRLNTIRGWKQNVCWRLTVLSKLPKPLKPMAPHAFVWVQHGAPLPKPSLIKLLIWSPL